MGLVVKKWALFFLSCCLIHGSVASEKEAQQAVNALAQGITDIVDKKKAPILSGFLTPEQRARRLKDIRANIKDTNLKMTQAEAKDALVEYLLLRFAELFQELANILGDAVAKAANNKDAGDAVRRLPGAFVDGFYLTAHLIKTMYNAEYLRALKSIQQSINCLLKKSERSGTACEQMHTVDKALSSVLSQASKFLLPIAQGLVLGVTIDQRKVKGILPLGVSVIAPNSPVEKELSTITDLVNNFLSLTDQLNSAIKK